MKKELTRDEWILSLTIVVDKMVRRCVEKVFKNAPDARGLEDDMRAEGYLRLVQAAERRHTIEKPGSFTATLAFRACIDVVRKSGFFGQKEIDKEKSHIFPNFLSDFLSGGADFPVCKDRGGCDVFQEHADYGPFPYASLLDDESFKLVEEFCTPAIDERRRRVLRRAIDKLLKKEYDIDSTGIRASVSSHSGDGGSSNRTGESG